MAKRRKTIALDRLLSWANFYMLNSGDDEAGQRKGHAALLEAALHSAGVYNGFRYLGQDEMAKSLYGATPGVVYENDRVRVIDDSRRVYY